MAKIYLASALENRANVEALADELIAAGHVITYRWSSHGPTTEMVGDYANNAARIAKLEANGVKDADLVIALLPGGRGTSTEIGIALGYGVEIWGVCDDWDVILKNPTVFLFHPSVQHMSSARMRERLWEAA